MPPKNWSEIEKSIVAEEEEEHKSLKGDAALDHFFKSVYAKASDDQRRAMVKSFQTSGGTVLSTDWASVENGKYEADPGT
jgi:suppressor of G2 allele of SKP1